MPAPTFFQSCGGLKVIPDSNTKKKVLVRPSTITTGIESLHDVIDNANYIVPSGKKFIITKMQYDTAQGSGDRVDLWGGTTPDSISGATKIFSIGELLASAVVNDFHCYIEVDALDMIIYDPFSSGGGRFLCEGFEIDATTSPTMALKLGSAQLLLDDNTTIKPKSLFKPTTLTTTVESLHDSGDANYIVPSTEKFIGTLLECTGQSGSGDRMDIDQSTVADTAGTTIMAISPGQRLCRIDIWLEFATSDEIVFVPISSGGGYVSMHGFEVDSSTEPTIFVRGGGPNSESIFIKRSGDRIFNLYQPVNGTTQLLSLHDENDANFQVTSGKTYQILSVFCEGGGGANDHVEVRTHSVADVSGGTIIMDIAYPWIITVCGDSWALNDVTFNTASDFVTVVPISSGGGMMNILVLEYNTS